jgi:phytoene synthase
MDNQKLRIGFREAKKITRKFAKTFYLASLFLPKDKRNASYAVYAICRLSDETVDDLSCPNPEENLKKLEQKISEAYTENIINTPLLAAFKQTINTYQIPKEYFDTLIKGMRMDLELKHYLNFSALHEYCYRVAGVVGQIMLKIFGYRNQAAQNYAIELGVAMQLTNILRDINEDLLRGRIYLPQEEMQNFGVSEQQLSLGQNNETFKNLLRFQIQRCNKLYGDSLTGIKLIDNCRARFVVLTMQEIYSEILRVIQKNDYDVFSKRAQVGKIKKLQIILKILREGKYL